MDGVPASWQDASPLDLVKVVEQREEEWMDEDGKHVTVLTTRTWTEPLIDAEPEV